MMEKAQATHNILQVHEATNYYDHAAKPELLAQFWGDHTPFVRFFARLRCDVVLELAAGHGRHVPQYRDKASRITLVDALEQNIVRCRERFDGDGKIDYYANNGVDLSALDDSVYDSVFSYDAMVHFELVDIWGYLQETRRVLQPGGLALFHHSNYSLYPTNIWTDNPQNRNFMSNAIFTHMADRAGLKVVDQIAMEWGRVKDLDGLTLLQRPPL
ncbi:class I SAM-dependent methyltransferase [Sphingobium sp. YR768]|uniref:class I SAM-dependent methyltransferase n=1 Tax=Sphingobium sp. YR768 TaxID=1884365 RepID=UPI000B881882|nr:class I SAM-dependent methyltransferase [Sphingobium sp. YR768]